MKFVKLPKAVFRLFAMSLVLAFLFTSPTVQAQSSSDKIPNISPDEFTTKGSDFGWKEGSTVPNLSFNDVNNKKFKLYDLLDKPVVIEFWTLDCKACAGNKKYLKAFYKQFNINIVGICTDDYPLQIRKTSNDQQLHWASIYDDSKKFNGETFAEKNDLAKATYLLITPDKKVAKVFYSTDDVKKLGVLLQQYFKG